MSGTLHHGDNLAVMADMASASVDLIYLDPPFNKKRDFRITDAAGTRVAFSDKCWAAAHDVLLHYAAGDDTTWNGDGGAGDVWADIADLGKNDHERTGYPTQKPEQLLVRLVLASSKPGEVVLDPNAGSGSALVAAELAGRTWVGIDRGADAVQTILERLRARCPRAEVKVVRHGETLTG